MYFVKQFVFVVFICVLSKFDCLLADEITPRFAEGENAFLENIFFHDKEKEANPEYWRTNAQNTLKNILDKQKNINHKVAKNIIFFLGDGMSIPTITASRIYKGQLHNVSGEEYKLFLDTFPYTGLSKTYCVDKQVADSACSATAYLSGVKANFQTIGVSAKVSISDCNAASDKANHVDSLAAWAQNAGKATGIVTTARVTHASPAGTYAHVSYREHECDSDIDISFNDSIKHPNCRDIATQLVTDRPGKYFNIVLGGGKKKFLPKTQGGERSDGRNLIEKWKRSHKNARYITNKKDLKTLVYQNFKNVDHVLGLFSESHMEFNLDANHEKEPSLEEMTEAAITMLQKESKGFFLFVEGGKIDFGHHASQAHLALDEVVEFDKAIEKAFKLTNSDDTLIVATADHSHVMTIAGYAERGNDILGLNTILSNVDRKPYTTLGYNNGNGYNHTYNDDGDRVDLTNWKRNHTSQYPSMVPLIDETHGGDDVAIFARGPWSDLFTGVQEQNAIPHFIAYASCIGSGRTVCNENEI